MKLLYETELKGHLNDTKDEIVSYAKRLIESNNANNWQRANELSFLLRRSNKNDESVLVSQMMFQKDPSVDKLNLYFVAVVDQGNIEAIANMSKMVDNYLKDHHLPYQKHLFATWLKAANRILDDEMFQYVFSMVPSEEKVQNSYIISQYYVNLNRHSMYSKVKEHYEALPDNVKNAKFVQKYYLNACARMGYYAGVDSHGSPSSSVKATMPTVGSVAGASTASGASEKKIFIVYGGAPAELGTLKAVLTASSIKYIDLAEAVGGGKTIIEEFEEQAANTDFALVVATPDIEGENGIWYVRQNVIFEYGYFVAKLGRENVRLLRSERGKTLETPSDVAGTKYISLDRGDWLPLLGQDLRAAGFTPIF